jgi:hypothetical protein
VGELREAIEAYRKALDRCPNFPDIRNRLMDGSDGPADWTEANTHAADLLAVCEQ